MSKVQGYNENLKPIILRGVVNPALKRWKEENQEFKVLLSCTGSSRLA